MLDHTKHDFMSIFPLERHPAPRLLWLICCGCRFLPFIELDDGKIWTGNPWKALYLMVKTMFSGYDFPLNQSIDWNIFYIWLVVWNMIFFSPYIGNFIIPTDELIFFRGVGLNHQPVFPLYHSFEIFPQFFQDFSKFSQIFPQFFPRFCPKLVVVWVFPGDWDFCARNSHLKIQETPIFDGKNHGFRLKFSLKPIHWLDWFLPGIPIFLSEYFENGAQLMADKLAVAVNQGANAVTYWHYCDRDYTQTAGGWAWLVTQVIHIKYKV